jgi:hypothetical protein
MTATNSRRTKAISALNPMAAFFQPFHMGLSLSTPKSRLWAKGGLKVNLEPGTTAPGKAQSAIGGKVIHVMRVIGVPLIIRQFPGSL